MRSGTQSCNINLQLPPADVSVSGNKLQGSHHILYIAQLHWARGITWSRLWYCDLRGQCHPIWHPHAWSAAKVHRYQKLLASSFHPKSFGRRRYRVPQGLSAGDACGPWGKPTATVHNMLETNSKGAFGAAIKALKLSRHVSPLGLWFYSRPRTVRLLKKLSQLIEHNTFPLP